MLIKNVKRLKAILKKGPTIVDIRSPVDFKNSNVPNSVNLPLRNFTSKLMGLKSKPATIIAYANTDSDDDLRMAEVYAEQLGVHALLFTTDMNTLQLALAEDKE